MLARDRDLKGDSLASTEVMGAEEVGEETIDFGHDTASLETGNDSLVYVVIAGSDICETIAGGCATIFSMARRVRMQPQGELATNN